MCSEFVKNEAELQANLKARIRKALPLLPANIKLEHYLHFRLGHHHVVVDGLESGKKSVCGRYDLLVMVNETPLLLAELKARDVKVVDNDIKQALSYARAHDPLVPLVLITNGKTTILKRTYDGADLQPSDVAGERLSSVLGAAAALAASDSEDAIKILLGSTQEVWIELLSEWSGHAISAITGNAQDFKFPIVDGFRISRAAVKQLEDLLLASNNVLILHGPPLSGVTNVLVQLAGGKTSEPVLFVNAKDCPDVLQFIANRLTRELKFGVSKDDVRNWLNTRRGMVNVTLLIDGLPNDGFNELLEFADAGILRLVLGMDSETFRRNSEVDGRTTNSLIGRLGVAIELTPLTDEEFDSAKEVFYESFGATFFNGAQYSTDLRYPRRLRVLGATLPSKLVSCSETDDHSTCIKLPPIPGPMMLDSCSSAFVSTPTHRFDLQILAKAFLLDAEENVDVPNWTAATWGRPSVAPGLLEQILGEKRVERLYAQGYISWIETNDLGPRMLVRVEELLAHFVAQEWADVLGKITTPENIISELRRLLNLATIVPFGDIALASAIIRASHRNNIIIGVVIRCLIEQEPTTAILTEGAQISILAKDGPIHVHFGEGMNEEVVGNMEPWIVLSHLASFPMFKEGDTQSENLSIFGRLGATEHLLYLPGPSNLADVPGVHFHDIPGIGSVPCLVATGIVEPLLQAMMAHIQELPDELIFLAEYALEHKQSYLAWRLLTVANVMIECADETIQNASKNIKEILRVWFENAMNEILEYHSKVL
jgi:hypothetical protein